MVGASARARGRLARVLLAGTSQDRPGIPGEHKSSARLVHKQTSHT